MADSQHIFSTDNMKYSLTIDGLLMDRLLLLCKESDGIETGGILVGYYTPKHDNAIVTDISSAPPDSERGRASFVRGTKGLQPWLHRLWTRQRRYYLGEWHFHPFNSPEPSNTDIHQLRKNSDTPPLRCPEPVMLIIGGDPKDKWTARAFVAPKGSQVLKMRVSEEIMQETNPKT
jgi:integrative and conjugative element protein (TIGR02256 family)